VFLLFSNGIVRHGVPDLPLAVEQGGAFVVEFLHEGSVLLFGREVSGSGSMVGIGDEIGWRRAVVEIKLTGLSPGLEAVVGDGEGACAGARAACGLDCMFTMDLKCPLEASHEARQCWGGDFDFSVFQQLTQLQAGFGAGE
jgi:hypothetical protein